MADVVDRFLAAIGVDPKGAEDQLVLCPFHDDTDPSFSVNPGLGVTKCWGRCGRGWTLEYAANRWNDQEETTDDREDAETGAEVGGLQGLTGGDQPPVHEGGGDLPGAVQPQDERTDAPGVQDNAGVRSAADGETLLAAFLAERGLTALDLGFDLKAEQQAGAWYAVFGDYVFARSLEGKEFRNAKGDARKLFWIGDARPRGRFPVWLVESALDGAVLRQLLPPGTAIAASLGAQLSKPQAFELRGAQVFILYDADDAGYQGARKADETLREYNASPVIVDFPEALGKDPGEAWQRNRTGLQAWMDKQLADYGTSDANYVRHLFGDPAPLIKISTTIPAWDDYLRGGFAPGVHTIGGEPEMGKSSLAVQIADETAGAVVPALGRPGCALIVTCELPKRQYWARIASRRCGIPWSDIEQSPSMVPEETQATLRGLADRIRIVSDWTVQRICTAAKDYDVVMVDYLQRLPGKFGTDAEYSNVSHNIRELANLGRDLGIVVLAFSSLPRRAYAGGFDENNFVSLGDFKGSGDIEYVSQSVVGIRRQKQSARVYARVLKNTRGMSGDFTMTADLGKQIFRPETFTTAEEKLS